MKIDQIEKYKIDENTILSSEDKRHIENYQQIIKFFEKAIEDSIKDGTTNYSLLHNSCIQCIRFLDNLIFTFDNSVQQAKILNQTLDKIIIDNKPGDSLGNGQE